DPEEVVRELRRGARARARRRALALGAVPALPPRVPRPAVRADPRQPRRRLSLERARDHDARPGGLGPMIQATRLTFKAYRNDLKSVWCPGCGDFGVLTALTKAFADLGLERENTVVVSGIGCSSRLPGYVETYGFNSVHGRALPIATGIKAAN